MENQNYSLPPELNIPPSQMPGAMGRPRSRRWLLSLIGGLLALVLGGGYLAHAQGWITIRFLPNQDAAENSNLNGSTLNTNQASQAGNNSKMVSNTNQSGNPSNTNSQTLNANTNASANTNLSTNTNSNVNGSAFEQMIERDRLGSCYLSKNHTAISYYAEALRSAYQGYVDNPQSESLCVGFSQSQLDQAGIEIRTDADQDGLNLLLERVYSASDGSSDTDGDGYSDIEEISNGYSPNGPGLLLEL